MTKDKIKIHSFKYLRGQNLYTDPGQKIHFAYKCIIFG